ncbi:hypothetical protein EJ04DRAFT_565832 [Polyplosphaeria fusca]|uniref:F-box domain-containing protein n=1 Tax=Polyplosphaeria fusca TaxID=682080 RepID=A0A9P4QW36_9PLEO|nr:hypothetical protein EJ04DRAFT_565832 [Polyplosphaeria fusca]
MDPRKPTSDDQVSAVGNSSLEIIPNEILFEIAQFLDSETLQSLVRVSRRFRSIVESEIYRVIDVPRFTGSSGLPRAPGYVVPLYQAFFNRPELLNKVQILKLSIQDRRVHCKLPSPLGLSEDPSGTFDLMVVVNESSVAGKLLTMLPNLRHLTIGNPTPDRNIDYGRSRYDPGEAIFGRHFQDDLTGLGAIAGLKSLESLEFRNGDIRKEWFCLPRLQTVRLGLEADFHSPERSHYLPTAFQSTMTKLDIEDNTHHFVYNTDVDINFQSIFSAFACLKHLRLSFQNNQLKFHLRSRYDKPRTIDFENDFYPIINEDRQGSCDMLLYKLGGTEHLITHLELTWQVEVNMHNLEFISPGHGLRRWDSLQVLKIPQELMCGRGSNFIMKSTLSGVEWKLRRHFERIEWTLPASLEQLEIQYPDRHVFHWLEALAECAAHFTKLKMITLACDERLDESQRLGEIFTVEDLLRFPAWRKLEAVGIQLVRSKIPATTETAPFHEYQGSYAL